MQRTGIYEIVNTANGKRYVGSAVRFNHRRRNHFHALRHGIHRNAKLQRAWDKHGESAFAFRILLVCDRANLRMYEQRCLDRLRPEYNIALDASIPMLGREHTLQTRARMAAAQVGVKRSVGARAAMSAALVGNKNSLGRIHPPEIRAKMSAIQQGRVQQPEHIAKRVAKTRGQKRTPEQRARLSAGRIAANARRKLQSESTHGGVPV